MNYDSIWSYIFALELMPRVKGCRLNQLRSITIEHMDKSGYVFAIFVSGFMSSSPAAFVSNLIFGYASSCVSRRSSVQIRGRTAPTSGVNKQCLAPALKELALGMQFNRLVSYLWQVLVVLFLSMLAPIPSPRLLVHLVHPRHRFPGLLRQC